MEAGSTDAFEELYDRYNARAYAVARSVCRDDGRAAEAVQDAFIAIWRNPGAYRAGRGAVSAWLLGIARYRAIDAVRGNARHASRRADEDKLEFRELHHDMTDRLVDRDDAARLNEQLQRLPEGQQEVIALAFYGQLTHSEIAAHLRLPAGTVKGRMRLGLQKLRTGIDQTATIGYWRAALTRALYDGDADQAGRVVMDATDHMPVTSMLDDVLAPALCSIGTLWQHRELTVADEHIATAICHRLLAQLSTNLQIAPAKTREKILLVSPSAERHTLGLLMTHNVLYGAGFDALLIGEGTRDSDLKAALLRHEPAIVALSATMSDEDAFADAARTIHEILPDSRIITGGASARELPAEIPAHFVERLDTVVEAVEGCLAPGRQRAL